jgi:DNA-binding NarL/FixJ family response regulator
MPESILIVDDEESVRRTLRDWVAEADLGVDVFTAGDAEEALRHAQAAPVDLAILDWNLGTGMDGLQLLEDLALFHPDVVAILVTGYAHQATPLTALRMGVRDYLDKSHDLSRESFVAAVRRQLERIVPAKRQRELHQAQAAFRSAVEQVLPLVRSTAALADPVPLPRAAAALAGFVRDITGARDAVLLVRAAGPGGDVSRAYATNGEAVAGDLVPFARSLAASALSFGEPCAMGRLAPGELTGIDLQPFERGRSNVLVAPLAVGGNVAAVVELFDKPGAGFTPEDRRLAAAAAAVGSVLLQQALADRQAQRTLFDAVEAALNSTHLTGAPASELPAAVRQSLQTSLARGNSAVDGGAAVELAEAIQALAARHGDAAVRHCQRLVAEVTRLLDAVTGTA